ncbi:MAG TPA: D-alanyl-D-alanine carboxypeptidase/D-alanyl-D-alanine-endopeptidase [Blastocatellia bacterium]|nr:D-alanyl-D-alanine carboxypeptidase/D-alanyl-D-alanine-endopeptidase [Blastocatellia bacterium]
MSKLFKLPFNQAGLIWVVLGSVLLGPSFGRQASSRVLVQERVSSHAQQNSPQPETLDSLRARIAAHIAQPRFSAATWGIKIVSLDSGKTLFEHNPQKYFNPASNAKLYTAALALNRLGGDLRIKTSLYSASRADSNGTLKGDLIVYGRGDPTMAARLNEGDYWKPLDPLVAQIVNAGVRRIEGDLIGDESFFSGPRFGSGWEWDDLQAYYGAEASALTCNDNSIDLFVKPAERVGLPCKITTGPVTSLVTIINRSQTGAKGTETRISVYRPVGENIIYVSGRAAIDGEGYTGSYAVHNPASLFVNMLKEALARRGITVTGRTRTIDWKYREVTPLDLSKLIEIGSIESMPMRDIIRETLKPSQNLWAQLLLLQVGASGGGPAAATRAQDDATKESRGAEGQRSKTATPSAGAGIPTPSTALTTEEMGVESMQEFLADAGIKDGEVLLEEGAGLSRRDVITPNATVALLAFMSRHRLSEAYRNALPIAGVDGTLERRMKGTSAAGNVRAKTGSLRYVFTLSGYVSTASGERLAFSIMLNNYYNAERSAALRDPSSAPKAAIPQPREDLDAIAIMLAAFTGKSQ